MGVLTLVDTEFNIVQSFDVCDSDLFLSHFFWRLDDDCLEIRGSTIKFKLKWFDYKIKYIHTVCTQIPRMCACCGCLHACDFQQEICDDDNTYM